MAGWPLMLVIMSSACGPAESAARHPRQPARSRPQRQPQLRLRGCCESAISNPSGADTRGDAEQVYPKSRDVACRWSMSHLAEGTVAGCRRLSRRACLHQLPKIYLPSLTFEQVKQCRLRIASRAMRAWLSISYTVSSTAAGERARTRRYTRPRASSPPAVKVSRSGRSGAARGQSPGSGCGVQTWSFLFHSW